MGEMHRHHLRATTMAKTVPSMRLKKRRKYVLLIEAAIHCLPETLEKRKGCCLPLKDEEGGETHLNFMISKGKLGKGLVEKASDSLKYRGMHQETRGQGLVTLVKVILGPGKGPGKKKKTQQLRRGKKR